MIYRSAWRSNRILRGGSWYYDPLRARVAFRSYRDPDRRSNVIGLRLVRRCI